MWNPFDFTDKKIIITGATSGIGQATAHKLTEQGARVYLLGRNEEKLQSAMKIFSRSGHKCYVMNFEEKHEYKEIFNDIVSDGKKVNGIVHCAGVAKILPLNAFQMKYMEDSMAVNFYPLMEMAKLLAKKKYHDEASIIGVSSLSVESPKKCQGIYSATKSAMNTMVQALALELAEKKIRINTVMPGIVRTKMAEESLEILTKEQRNMELNKYILGMAEPEDIADVILFLLSDASRMITGRAIYADGGYLNF